MTQTQMFCYQCEQTSKGEGCTVEGICGKSPEVASLQDLLIYLLRGLSQLALEGRKVSVKDEQVDKFICEATFATLTNVNFDPDRIVSYIHETVHLRDLLRVKVRAAGGNSEIPGASNLVPEKTRDGMVGQGMKVGIKADPTIDPDLNSLYWLLTYGTKGVATYTYHAYRLGKEDDSVFEFIEKSLAAPLDKSLSVKDLVALCMKCGEVNIRALELLDAANTETYGNPVPTSVPLAAKKGKAILVSGHDLKDLEEVLRQSENKGIYVYTHGEMLPAHGYPKLKEKYPHFYGHYGKAWQNQKREFAGFPGAILVTTNCLIEPRESYKENIFTCGPVGWHDITHLKDSDFTLVIEKALEMPGFKEDMNGRHVTVGFGRNAVLSVADKVIDAVKKGEIKHFFLVGGCDGAKRERNYYSEFVTKTPSNTIILTLGCAKFRFFDKELIRVMLREESAKH